jgi:hypothetical protein
MLDKIKKFGNDTLESSKNIFNGAKEKVSEKVNTYSGKEVLSKVEEYSEIYGDILIGLDKEVSNLKSKIEELSTKNSSERNQNYLPWILLSTAVNIILFIVLMVKLNA